MERAGRVTKGIGSSEGRARVGVIASDPLRSLGLISILDETGVATPVPMEMEEAYTELGIEALVLDSRASDEGLTETIARLRRERPGLKIVVMDASLEAEHVQAVIGAGAKGYLAETAGESEIRMAIEVVLDGSIWAPRKVLARLIDGSGGAAGPGPAGESIAEKMTPRELEVLQLLMAGRTNRDIAMAMGIDEVTVKAHLGRMLRKTGASNRVELTLKALEERSSEGQR
jgi:DNA-binding NarL/FixJ family response regulator